MSELSGFPYREVQFDKKGRVHDPEEVQALREMIEEEALTDLFVFSHGWNNDMAQARELYERLSEHLRAALDGGSGGGLPGRTVGLMGVLWPSKKFADQELIPSGAASLAGGIPEHLLEEQIDGLAGVFDGPGADAALQEARELVIDLEDKASARRRFADLLRSALGPASELDAEARAELPAAFFSRDGDELLDDLAKPPPLPPGSPLGGAAALADPAGSAAAFGGLFGSVKAGARNLLNLLTYYQMKKRAGIVGAGGVHQVLAQLRQSHPDLKLHLVGHSFGGRLVAAAARGPEGEPPLVFHSMALLQAAFSHNGFTEKFDGEHDGFFRRVVAEKRVTGPILATHTVNDKAVGIAYPLASRIARQAAAGLGDKDDPFGGIGRNGAQKMKPQEVDEGVLLDPGGAYAFAGGKIFNLQADDQIANHGDVAGPAVAHALLTALAAT